MEEKGSAEKAAREIRRRTRTPAWKLSAGLLLCALPIAAYFQLLFAATVDVPNLDDYDTAVSFLNRFVDSESVGERVRLVFEPHIEHRPAFLRTIVVASHAWLGRLDFNTLNVIGSLGLAVLVAALLCAFRRETPLAAKLLAFAPAALFLVHPQYWSALLWPTCSISNFYVAAFALLTFLALRGRSKASFAAALGFAVCAVYSQGNGFLVPPLGLLVLVLTAASKRRCRVWGGLAALLLAGYFAGYESPDAGADPLRLLGEPEQLVAYGLNLVGSAPAFSQPVLAAAAGVALVTSFAALAWRGWARRNPALFCLGLFILLSVGLNAGARAIQGAEAPLAQPRYRFYSALFLALNSLGWAETLRTTRLARRFVALSLLGAVAFSVLSFQTYRDDVFALAGRLERGLDTWWRTGGRGLAYPRLHESSAFLMTSLGKGLLRVPTRWIDEGAAVPMALDLPDPGPGVSFRLGTVFQDDEILLVDGWADTGSFARNQRVFLVLRGAEKSPVFPARSVFRPELRHEPGIVRRRLGHSGFRAIIRHRDVPPGSYRLGVLVRRGAVEYLSFRGRQVVIPETGPARAPGSVDLDFIE